MLGVLPVPVEASTGATLYVSPTGTSGAPGTEAAPLSVNAAISRARPGDTVLFLPGTYPRIRVFGLHGEPSRPIVFRSVAGPDRTIISENRYDAGYGFLIDSSSHIIVTGFTVTRIQFGVDVTASTGVEVSNMTIFDIGQEGIHFRRKSSHGKAIGNRISRTGNLDRHYGEGIYVGTGQPDQPGDTTNNILVADNLIFDVPAEAIDIKGWVHDITVERNRVDNVHTGWSGAVVVGHGLGPYPDQRVVIRNNVISNVRSTSQWRDGKGIMLSAPATVYNNVIYNVEHFGINLDETFDNPNAQTVRIFNNTIYNAGVAPFYVYAPGAADLHLFNNLGIDLPGNMAATASMFVDPARGDFSLRPGAAAIDTASPVPGLTHDIAGVPRPQGQGLDFGAYEFKSPTTSTPTTAAPTTAAPTTTVPPTTVPSTTVPSITAPSSTAPSTTVPSTTVPSTTVPTSIESSLASTTTVPATTVPSTTVPSSTAPSSTVPSTTVPSSGASTSTPAPAGPTLPGQTTPPPSERQTSTSVVAGTAAPPRPGTPTAAAPGPTVGEAVAWDAAATADGAPPSTDPGEDGPSDTDSPTTGENPEDPESPVDPATLAYLDEKGSRSGRTRLVVAGIGGGLSVTVGAVLMRRRTGVWL